MDTSSSNPSGSSSEVIQLMRDFQKGFGKFDNEKPFFFPRLKRRLSGPRWVPTDFDSRSA
jgi:hypothetical protein